MSNRRSYSTEQRELIAIGMSKGWPLTAIEGSPEFQAATRAHDKFIAKERENFKAQDYLAFGNDKGFTSREEREAAFAHPLYHESEEYRIAVRHKASQTPDAIMGIYTKPDPLTPEALIAAAEEDLYHTTRQNLFDKAGSKDPMVAAEARLQILKLATDPQWAPIRDKFERTEAETKPYETWLKQAGPQIVQTFPQGTEAEMQAECARRNAENYEARPGGLGDAQASGEATVTFK